jgi:branched-chain amino acid aminotransferase
VTRDSVLTLLREKGITVEERPISIEELAQAHSEGQLKEAFGTGTAASIAPIAALTWNEQRMELPPVDTWETVNWLREELSDIRYGRKPDTHGWLLEVSE